MFKKTHFEKQLEKEKRKSEIRKQKIELQKIKEENRGKKMETSKLLAIYLFAVFNVILVFSLILTCVTLDLSCLAIIITDMAAQILAYAIYCLKSYNGKKQEEQVKLEKAKITGSLGELLEAVDESESEFCTDSYDEPVG